MQIVLVNALSCQDFFSEKTMKLVLWHGTYVHSEIPKGFGV